MAKSVRKSKDTAPNPKFRKVTLDNGVRVLAEVHPHSRAVSCGILIEKGTRDELDREMGLAHFVEHLVFKRTQSRSAYEISRDMEAVGGELNAFTSREYTCFVSQSLSEHMNLSIDVLSDLVCRPKFVASDIEKEKQVVVQEISMSEDQLEDSIFDRYFENVYPKTTMGHSILGSVASIEGMDRQRVVEFHRRQYISENAIVAVAGNIRHDDAVRAVEKYLRFQNAGKKPANGLAKSPAVQARKAPTFNAFRKAIRKPSEQAHVLLGMPAADFRSDLRFEAYIVNALLGGGMTSRLYQTVREDRGLVYSIYSMLTTFTDIGQMMIYAGSDPKNSPLVVDLAIKELKKLRKSGVKKADLDLFKTQVKGQILLGADDVDNRMNSLAVNEMVFGKYRSVNDVIRDIDGITLDSLHEYIDAYINVDELAVLMMGPLPEKQTKSWLETL